MNKMQNFICGGSTLNADTKVCLSVIIPAFNEERRLPETLAVVWTYLTAAIPEFEILVVDDGSLDNTAKVAKRFAADHKGVRVISYQPNRGKGRAVKVGMQEGRGEFMLFLDADLATPIEETGSLFKQLASGYDVAIGSRAVCGSQLLVRQPWYRELGGRTFNLVIQLFALPGIRDTQCGFKLFSRRAALEIFARCAEDGFGFDIEVLYLARRLGYKIAEVPVRWRHVGESKVRLIRDALRMFASTARVVRHHRGIKAVTDESCRV
jgi:dolichyl-phosphate beta-glucosyltransferase